MGFEEPLLRLVFKFVEPEFPRFSHRSGNAARQGSRVMVLSRKTDITVNICHNCSVSVL